MVNNSEPAPSKKKRYCVKFNDSLEFRTGEDFALCTVCRSDFSVWEDMMEHMEKKMISIDTRTP